MLDDIGVSWANRDTQEPSESKADLQYVTPAFPDEIMSFSKSFVEHCARSPP